MITASNERNISGLRCIMIYLINENKLNSLALFIFIGTLKQILINLHLHKKGKHLDLKIQLDKLSPSLYFQI